MHSHIVPSFLIMAAISDSNSSRLLMETEDKKVKFQVEPERQICFLRVFLVL